MSTCNCLQSSCRVFPEEVREGLRERKKGDVFMHIALGIAFGVIAAAPFIGRWRANVWVKKHMPATEQTVNSIPEIA